MNDQLLHLTYFLYDVISMAVYVRVRVRVCVCLCVSVCVSVNSMV